MQAADALSELRELSAQIERAVVLREDGSLLAATPDEPAAAERLAAAARELCAAAAELRSGGPEVARVEVELAEGALFVVREGGRTIAARTCPRPTAGLVVYDLRTCLERLREAEAAAGAAPGRRPRRRPATAGEGP